MTLPINLRLAVTWRLRTELHFLTKVFVPQVVVQAVTGLRSDEMIRTELIEFENASAMISIPRCAQNYAV